MIKAILFDFDDTLINRRKASYAMYKNILKNNTNHHPESILFEAILQDMITWDQYGNTNKNYVSDQLKKKYNIVLKIDDLNNYWETNFWEYTVVSDDAISVLQELKKKYKLGVITNGNKHGQFKKVEFSGLIDYFDCVVVSGDYDVHKPDKLLFDKSIEQLQIEPNEAIYVGDTFSNDIYGAINAGLIPVWIWPSSTRYCDYSVHRIFKLSELPDLVEQINNDL